jgi:hypothetical protein
MTNIKFAIPLTKRTCHLSFTLKKNLTLGDSCIGIDSGRAKGGWHFILLDYDEHYPEEFESLIKEYKIRRGLIVESSPKKYHALSFSKLKYGDMLAFASKSRADNKHKFCISNMGFSTLRVSAKNGVKPKVIKEIENKEGIRFYCYDEERLYRKMIDEDNGIELKRVLSKLTKEERGKAL